MLSWQLQYRNKKFLKLCWDPQTSSSGACKGRTLHQVFFRLTEVPLLVELQRRRWAVVIVDAYKSAGISLSHSMFHPQPPSSPQTPNLTPWSQSRQWVGYSTVYNISNSLSSVWLGRLSDLFPSNYRLAGFLKWGFWRNNTFLSELKGKNRDIWPAAHTVNHTDRAQALSDALGY